MEETINSEYTEDQIEHLMELQIEDPMGSMRYLDRDEHQ